MWTKDHKRSDANHIAWINLIQCNTVDCAKLGLMWVQKRYIDASSAQATARGLNGGFSFRGLKKLKGGGSWIHSTAQRKEHSKTEFGKKNSEIEFGESENFYRSKFISRATGVRNSFSRSLLDLEHPLALEKHFLSLFSTLSLKVRASERERETRSLALSRSLVRSLSLSCLLLLSLSCSLCLSHTCTHTHTCIHTCNLCTHTHEWITSSMNESCHTIRLRRRRALGNNRSFHWLQHTATPCNALQHTATHGRSRQHTATHCNTLRHTATHRTTTHCNTPKLREKRPGLELRWLPHTAAHGDTRQHIATY